MPTINEETQATMKCEKSKSFRCWQAQFVKRAAVCYFATLVFCITMCSGQLRDGRPVKCLDNQPVNLREHLHAIDDSALECIKCFCKNGIIECNFSGSSRQCRHRQQASAVANNIKTPTARKPQLQHQQSHHNRKLKSQQQAKQPQALAQTKTSVHFEPQLQESRKPDVDLKDILPNFSVLRARALDISRSRALQANAKSLQTEAPPTSTEAQSMTSTIQDTTTQPPTATTFITTTPTPSTTVPTTTELSLATSAATTEMFTDTLLIVDPRLPAQTNSLEDTLVPISNKTPIGSDDTEYVSTENRGRHSSYAATGNADMNYQSLQLISNELLIVLLGALLVTLIVFRFVCKVLFTHFEHIKQQQKLKLQGVEIIWP